MSTPNPLLAPRYLTGTNYYVEPSPGVYEPGLPKWGVTINPSGWSAPANTPKNKPEYYGYRIGQENIIPYVYSILWNYTSCSISTGTHWWGRKSTDPFWTTAAPAADILLILGYSPLDNKITISGSGIDNTILKRVDESDLIGGYATFPIVPTGITNTSTGEISGGTTTLKICWRDQHTTPSAYYWYKNNVLISGANSSEYTITLAAGGAAAGVYKCGVNMTPSYQGSSNFATSNEVTITYNSSKYYASYYTITSNRMIQAYGATFGVNSTDNVLIEGITFDGNHTNNYTTNSPTSDCLSLIGTNHRINKCKFVDFGVGNTVYEYDSTNPSPGLAETFVILSQPPTANWKTNLGPKIENCIFTQNGVKDGPEQYPTVTTSHIPEYTCIAVHGSGSVVKNNQFIDLLFDDDHRSPIHAISFGGNYSGSFYENTFKNVQGPCFYIDSYKVTGSKIQDNYCSSSWNFITLTSQTWPSTNQIANFKNIDMRDNTVILSDGPTTYNYFVGMGGGFWPSHHIAYFASSTLVHPYDMVTSSLNVIKKGYWDGTPPDWASGAVPQSAAYSYIIFPRDSSMATRCVGPTYITSSNEIFASRLLSITATAAIGGQTSDASTSQTLIIT